MAYKYEAPPDKIGGAFAFARNFECPPSRRAEFLIIDEDGIDNGI